METLIRTPATRTRRMVMTQALPVGLAVAAFGLSYGVLAVAAGLTPTVATASSLLVLAGGSQFAFVGVLAAGGNPFAGAAGGLMLNLRMLAFGAAVARHLPPGPRWRRGLDGYLVTDESVALALAGPRSEVTRRFRVVGVTIAIAWVAATAAGAYGGRLLGDPGTLGLDAAFPAGFLALLAPWLRTRRGRVAAVTGTALALALTPITPPGVPIVAAGLGALVAMRVPDDARGGGPDEDAADPETDPESDPETGPDAGPEGGR